MDFAQGGLALTGRTLPLYVAVISCVVYLSGRGLWNFIHQGKQSHTPSLDRAEKGSLEQQDTMSACEIFQLEKRAFFSKVGRPGYLSGPQE